MGAAGFLSLDSLSDLSTVARFAAFACLHHGDLSAVSEPDCTALSARRSSPVVPTLGATWRRSAD